MRSLLWASLAFLGGIFLASLAHVSVAAWLILAAAAAGVAIAWRVISGRQNLSSPYPIALASVCLASLLLGAARYQLSIPKQTPDYIAWYNDRQYDLLVTGTLSEPPDYRDTYTNLRLQVTSVDTGDDSPLKVHGLILARVPPNERYRYGDQVQLRGRLETPPENEDFSFRDYLARQGIHAYMSQAKATRLPDNLGNPILRAVYALKERALFNIYRLFPDPEASLLAGILLGVDTGLPADLQQAFKNTGTAHIIAISGFNITIIAGLFVAFFSRFFGPRKGALFAVLGIALYTSMVGADAAVVRAAIMGGLALFARQIGRRQDGLITLTTTAGVMALWNPNLLWDVGFQLSFAATLGLILYAEPFSQAFSRLASRILPEETVQKLAGPVGEFVLFTLAAQLTTLPVMAYHFGRISLVSLIANPFILPAQPLVMILGGLAVLCSLVYLPLGQVAAWLAWPLTAYTIRAVELFDRLPHGVIVLGEFSLLFVLLFYAVLLAWTFAGTRIRDYLATRIREEALVPTTALLSGLVILTLLTWQLALASPDGRLHLTFLDVGSADAILIQTPDGRAVLVNGGSSTSLLSDALGRRLPLSRRSLDWLVVGSTQQNQTEALPHVLDRFQPQNVLWSGNRQASYSSRDLEEWLSDHAVPVTYARPDHTLDLGKGADLRVLSETSRGAVLLLEWESFRALLPVGMNFEALEKMAYGQAIGPVSVLLLADSGYAPINPPAWIEALAPQIIVLDVAAGDKDGMPSDETLESAAAYNLLRTDQNGWINVTSDGSKMWVETELQGKFTVNRTPSPSH
jgi:competence protein ComEC